MMGAHLLTHWSRTQSCIALSSGEAELNAMLKAASEGLNLKYLLEEIGEKRELHLRGDSSASHGTLQRLGSGRVKHLQTRQPWLQEKVYAGEVSVEKIPRKINWADSLTHAWTVAEEGHFEEMGIRSRPEEVRGECLQGLATETGSTEQRACTTETPVSYGQSSRSTQPALTFNRDGPLHSIRNRPQACPVDTVTPWYLAGRDVGEQYLPWRL